MQRCLVIALLLLTSCVSFVPTSQAADRIRTFPETGYSVSGSFLDYWEGNGALPVFGFPISDQRAERGSEGVFDSQWFERERFERHPENQPPYQILLGRLGDEMLRRQGRDWRSFPQGSQQPGCRFFSETNHSLCEPFLSYWQGHGLEFDGRRGTSGAESLALFGLPLSELDDFVLIKLTDRRVPERMIFRTAKPHDWKKLLGTKLLQKPQAVEINGKGYYLAESSANGGGAIGAYIGMKHYHHKTKHRKFTIGIPIMIVIHILIVIVIAVAYASEATFQ